MSDTYGRALQAARKRARIKTQLQLADLIGVSEKTIRNWEGDKHVPGVADQEKLEAELGQFYFEGDPVEAAVRQSSLTGFRQTKVIGYYQEQLHEQDREDHAG